MQRLVGAGADCIKILLYYTPFDPPEVNDIKHAWVERIGGECTAADVPFFLEFVGYVENGDEKGIEYAKQKPEVVRESMEEFSKPQYGVDVLKVEVPVNMAFVAGTKSCKGDSAYTRDQAKEHFRRAAAAAKKPFIYLSAGVNNDVFAETLDLAAESGVEFSGVLCGRATWKDGIPIYGKQGAEGAGGLAERSGREEHQQRELAPDGREALVQLLRRNFSGRAGRLEAARHGATTVRKPGCRSVEPPNSAAIPAKSRSLIAFRARPAAADGTGKKKRGTWFGMTRLSLFLRTAQPRPDVKPSPFPRSGTGPGLAPNSQLPDLTRRL